MSNWGPKLFWGGVAVIGAGTGGKVGYQYAQRNNRDPYKTTIQGAAYGTVLGLSSPFWGPMMMATIGLKKNVRLELSEKSTWWHPDVTFFSTEGNTLDSSKDKKASPPPQEEETEQNSRRD